jgi:hypothetical protein
MAKIGLKFKKMLRPKMKAFSKKAAGVVFSSIKGLTRTYHFILTFSISNYYKSLGFTPEIAT